MAESAAMEWARCLLRQIERVPLAPLGELLGRRTVGSDQSLHSARAVRHRRGLASLVVDGRRVAQKQPAKPGSRPRQSRSRGARRSASSMRLLSSSSDNRTGVLAGTGPWTNPCLSGCSRLPTCSARNGGGPFGESCGPIRDRLNVANGSLAGRLPAGRRIRGELYDRTADRQTVTVRSAPIAPQLSARARPGRFGQLEGCGMIA
jgi:hypothetical protein